MAGEASQRFQIRDAAPSDVPVILDLVRKLADFEHLAHEAQATPELMHAALFGASPKAFALMCDVNGQSVGVAICYYTFSTFVGRHGIYVEDVYVRPDFRNRGIGRAFFRHIAQRAVAEKCGRVEWMVLDWNENALRFYRSLGADSKDQWRLQRLTENAIAALAA